MIRTPPWLITSWTPWYSRVRDNLCSHSLDAAAHPSPSLSVRVQLVHRSSTIRKFVTSNGPQILIIGFLVALASCANHQQATSPNFEVVTDVRHTMELIIDPAVDIIWNSAGSIITDAGEHDLAPTTLEAWVKVEAAAAVLTESGNLLMMPGRSAGPDWNAYAGDLISSGKLAMTAAQQQDASALFDAGGRIYQVCLACHSQYLVTKSAQ